ncbi:MAG: peptidyl-prolyl cis-trans isomerase [Candidatus Sumerlaeaceae bacterium]
MKRRFRRHSRTPAQDAAAREHAGVARFPFNLLWIIFGVVVLGTVIFYDRRQIQQAREHIEHAQYFQQHGVYPEALKEYQRAYKNKRLGRRHKGEVALAIGDIYFDQFENYDMARTYFERAKLDNPKLFQTGNTQERLKAAAQKAVGSGQTTSDSAGSTITVVQRVELLNPPQEDLRGPVLARFKGGEILAGELLRWMKDRTEFTDPQLRDDPRRLQQLLNLYMDRVLRYQAAIEAGVQRDPDISARLYDYQRTLISERHAVQTRQQSKVVTTAQVQNYYEHHRDNYVQPGNATIAMIKSKTAGEAQDALEQLRKGIPLADVATSFSIDEESVKRRGVTGVISENDTSIPGVGEAPEIVKQLVKLRANSVTGVIPANGSFFIFQVVRGTPGRVTTLDEARAEIEMKLRGTALDSASTGLAAALKEKYSPEILQDGVHKFWQFAAGSSGNRNEKTTSSTLPLERQTTESTAQMQGALRST